MKQLTPEELKERNRLIREGRAKDTELRKYGHFAKHNMQTKKGNNFRGHSAVVARLNG